MSDTPYPGRQAREPVSREVQIPPDQNPVFNDEQLCKEVGIRMEEFNSERGIGARWMRVAYEAKIASGELRVARNKGARLTAKGTLCNNCDNWINVAYDRYCSLCGNNVQGGRD